MMENVVETSPPSSRTDLSDHVVICGHSSRTSSLFDELEARDVSYVIVEPDRENAIDLVEE